MGYDGTVHDTGDENCESNWEELLMTVAIDH
jgi:hypothetical protein